MQFAPCIHRSGHTDWEHAARRNRFAMQLVELRFHLFIAQTERRAAAAIDAIKFVFLRAINDGKKVAADSVRNRFHQAKRGVGRDRGIDRVTAALQDVEPDLRGCRHARANHSVPSQDFRARGERFSGDAIDLGERNPRACNKQETKDSETERYDHVFTLALLSSRANARHPPVGLADTSLDRVDQLRGPSPSRLGMTLRYLKGFATVFLALPSRSRGNTTRKGPSLGMTNALASLTFHPCAQVISKIFISSSASPASRP